LLAPWTGREVINYIVNMCSVLAAIAYLYTCWISMRVAEERRARILSGIGMLCAVIFLGLLLLPGSPSQLGTLEFIALGLWLVAGIVVYVWSRRRVAEKAADELETVR